MFGEEGLLVLVKVEQQRPDEVVLLRVEAFDAGCHSEQRTDRSRFGQISRRIGVVRASQRWIRRRIRAPCVRDLFS